MSLFDSQKIQLISMQIPKTVGAAFQSALEGAYGRGDVVRFDMRESKAYMNERRYPGGQLSNKRVLHGSFRFNGPEERFELPEARVADVGELGP